MHSHISSLLTGIILATGCFVARPASAAGVIPNDPILSQQWYLRTIGATNAWATSTGSSNIVVAVIDTGVDYTHPDLAPNMWRNPGETGLDTNGNDKATNGLDDDGNGYVDDVHGIDALSGRGDPMDGGFYVPSSAPVYHGTSTAGIIGAVGNNGIGIAGINWSVRIMAIKVFEGDNTAPALRSPAFRAVRTAWDYVLQMKRRGVPIRVVTDGTHLIAESRSLREIVATALEEGILTVIPAGNDSLDHDVFSIASDVAPLLTVAASTDTDALASFSNFGKGSVHLVAPGVSIWTLNKGGGYTTHSGTSVSFPMVAGTAALLFAARPELTPDEVKAAILGSTDPIPGLRDKVITGGRLNLARAMQYLSEANPPAIAVTALPFGQRTPADAPIQVTFSRPMNPNSVENAFAITPPARGSFSWSADHRSFAFVPDLPFDRTTNYSVRISGSAQDETGGTLDGNFNRLREGSPIDDYVWTFRFPVVNDYLEDAQPLAGSSGTIAGNNRYSTWQWEDGEPVVETFYDPLALDFLASVWYRWTPPASEGWFTFDVSSAAFDSYLAVYTGDEPSRLRFVTGNDNYGARINSRISFLINPDTNYLVQVIGKSGLQLGQSGPFTLRWFPTPSPSVLSFNPATGYPGQFITLFGSNFTGATRVLFNGLPTTFTLSTNAAFTDLQLTAILPPGATTGPLTIETPHGNFTTTSNLTVITLPRLTIQQLPAPNLVELSWPSTTGFNLQRTDTLTSTSTWAAASAVATRLVNGIRYVTVTNAVPNRFFRLHRP